MGFVKVIKNKAYFKRFQTKYRRRRESKTDYYARQRLITQDKNKYKTPKYRFVVRFTNRDIIAQIVAADLTHDVVLASAYSHELKRYGIKLGLTNWAAAYATGLLLARRVNAKFNLKYEGNTEVNGEDYNVEPEEEGPRPFKALLDVGLKRTTTGSRLFGAVKGACDGGINIPHSDRRFPGTTKEGDVVSNPEQVRKYIFGGHVSDYMKQLKDEDDESYQRQFSAYISEGIDADSIEQLYSNAHKQIRADPHKKRTDSELGYFKTRSGSKPTAGKPKESKSKNVKKLTTSERRARVVEKLKARGVEAIPI